LETGALPIELLTYTAGGQGGNRTPDTAIFSRMLYQLSYLAPIPQRLPSTKNRPASAVETGNSGGGIRTRDLRVMSPTSYQAAPPRDKDQNDKRQSARSQPLEPPHPGTVRFRDDGIPPADESTPSPGAVSHRIPRCRNVL
jgi:hypothetical protein